MVTFFLLYFRDFLKFGHKSSHRMWKTKLQTLCLILDSRFGKFFPKMQNLSFTCQNIHLLFSPIICIFSNAVINIVSLVWSSSFRSTLESKHTIWNKIYMRDMKTNISVKILYFFRRSWLTQILRGPLREEFLPKYFILGVLLNGSDPC